MSQYKYRYPKYYNLVYNNTCKEEISELEKLAAILYYDYLEDISSILESVILDNMEKEKFINYKSK